MNYGYQGPHVNNFGHPPHSSNVVSPGSGISNPPHPLNSATHHSSNSPSHRYPTPFMQPNSPTNPNKPGDSNVLPSQLGLRATQNMPAGPQSGVKGPISPVSPTAQNPTIYHQPSPTIFPCYGFDPKKDAQALRKAMKGFGTDERTLIEILTKRMRPQREEIALHYKTIFNRDLVKDIKSDTSGNFKKLLVALMTPLPQYYASELYGAMAGLGTRESVLFQILCTVSNHEMRLINDEYRSMYEKSLQTDISADTSSHLKRLLIALTHGTRDESSHLNPAAALEDAKELQQAGELRVGTDEFVFHQIFVSRNRPQLQLVFNSYQELTGHSIEKILMKEFTGDLRDALLAIAKSTQDPTGFFAEELYKSLKGKNDSSLIRLIVTHCELDLGEIKCKFHSKYSKYLRDMVSNECSGDYKKALLSLIG